MHRFAIVRHPEDRVVSVFQFQRDVEQTIPPETSFEDWLGGLSERRRNSPHDLDNHPRRSSELVPEAATVFRLEDGMEAVVAWLDGIEGASRPPREILRDSGYEMRMQTAGRAPGPPVVVTPAARRLIEEFYEVDFRRFGYAPRHQEVIPVEPDNPGPSVSTERGTWQRSASS